MQWVRDNIAAFGGDNTKITLAGQSAGCMSVQCLVTSNQIKGLISGAILQSGGGLPGFTMDYSQESRKAISAKLMRRLGAENLDEMLEFSPEMIAYAAYETAEETQLKWCPVIDSELIKNSISEQIENGKILDIPYIIGSTADEMSSQAAELLAQSAVSFANCRGAQSEKPVFVYRFAHKLPGDNAGAFHSSELWYEFATLKNCRRPMSAEDYEISDRMSGYIVNFVKHSNPNDNKLLQWSAYKDKNNICIF